MEKITKEPSLARIKKMVSELYRISKRPCSIEMVKSSWNEEFTFSIYIAGREELELESTYNSYKTWKVLQLAYYKLIKELEVS